MDWQPAISEFVDDDEPETNYTNYIDIYKSELPDYYIEAIESAIQDFNNYNFWGYYDYNNINSLENR